MNFYKVKHFYLNRFVWYNIFFDALIIIGSFILNWDPARILAFYWLDTCIATLFYIIYIRWLGHLKLPFKFIIVASIAIGILRTYFILITNLSVFTIINSTGGLANERLFEPYYETSFFLTLSVICNLNLYKRIKRGKDLNKDLDIEPFIHTNCFLQLMAIPCILFVMTIFFALTLNTKLSLIISFIIFRNLLDIWRNKRLLFFNI